MKHVALFSTLCLALVGCNMTGGFLTPQPDRAAKPAETRGSYRAPIVADQVTTDNAKDKAKALDVELDRDLEAAIEARDKSK
jgi:hypothetical protein